MANESQTHRKVKELIKYCRSHGVSRIEIGDVKIEFYQAGSKEYAQVFDFDSQVRISDPKKDDDDLLFASSG